jgi:hypothetical protein
MLPNRVRVRSVKGSHIVQAQEWVDRRLGAGTFQELTRQGGASWSAVLPMGWYDVDVLNAALRVAAQRLGSSLEDIVTEIASSNAERDLTSIYRVFLRVAQPQRVLAQTPRLWRTYVSFGEAAALRNEQGYYLGQGTGFSAELLEWACGCWRGFIPTTIELAGGRNIRARILERGRESDGSHSVRLEVTYSL